MSDRGRPGGSHRAAAAPRRSASRSLRDYGIVIAFVALFITLSIASDVFLIVGRTWSTSLSRPPRSGSWPAAARWSFIAGGFDLSVGAVAAFSGVIAAKAFAEWGLPMWPAFILGALAGLGFGLGNGLLVTVGPHERIHSHARQLDHHLRPRDRRHRRLPGLD